MITKPSQLRKLLENTPSYEFLHKPCAAIITMHKGIPNVHAPYSSQKSAIDLYKIHSALNATHTSFIEASRLEKSCRRRSIQLFTDIQGEMLQKDGIYWSCLCTKVGEANIFQ